MFLRLRHLPSLLVFDLLIPTIQVFVINRLLLLNSGMLDYILFHVSAYYYDCLCIPTLISWENFIYSSQQANEQYVDDMTMA